MSVNLKEVAERCKEVIEAPENNLNLLKDIIKRLDSNDCDSKVLYVAILKVFKALIPLYKVRTLKDKIIHKTDSLEVSKFDKLILEYYGEFVSKILKSEDLVSYKCAIELLNSFDHFNFIDKIVEKVLKGTIKQSSIGLSCCQAIQNKLVEDIKGDITFVIVNQMFETDFNPIVLSYLIEINFLKDFLVKGTVEEPKKPRDKFFKYERSGDKKKRKIEKQRRIAENLAQQEQEAEEKRNLFVIHRKIVDALQRLYFVILKDKLIDKFKFTFIGLSKYKKFIRSEFLEGLYVLLNDAIAIGDIESKLFGITTTLDIYSKFKYDFKRLVDALYCVVYPFNYNLTNESLVLVESTIEELFIKYKQPMQRVYALTHRLILLGCVRQSIIITKIINLLSSVYEIDLLDVFESKENLSEDVDAFRNFPFYDFCLFKKML